MSEEENAAVIHRFVGVFNTGDVPTLDMIIASNFVNHGLAPDHKPSLEDAKQVITLFRTAFPDIHITPKAVVAIGDKVVLRETLCGTHSGEVEGVAPSGKQVTVEVIDQFTLCDGKIVESWVHLDLQRLLQQVGVKPIPRYEVSEDVLAAASPGPVTSVVRGTSANAAPTAADK